MIMVKIGGSKKSKLSQKTSIERKSAEIYKFSRNGKEFINFVEIGGIYNMHHRLRRDGRPCVWLSISGG